MGTTRLFFRSVLTLGLVAVVSSYGLAAERSSAAPDESVLIRASRVMKARVVSTQGETLGQVHDVVLTPDLNGISYLAVSRGGFLGIGSTLHAIPWSAVSPGLNDETYVVPVTLEQFKQSKGFSSANWPGSAESIWPAASMDRGEAPVYSTQVAAYSGDVQDRRFSRITGRTAGRRQEVGDVHDTSMVTPADRLHHRISWRYAGPSEITAAAERHHVGAGLDVAR
jgi:sporulation protein YlmC with PRC-barrel domain